MAATTGETQTNRDKTGHKNEKVGEVISTKMAKTIVVEVTRRVPHPVYKRIVSKRKKFYAHDEEATAKVGDVVRIIECRPLSRLEALGVGLGDLRARCRWPWIIRRWRQCGRYAREEDDQERK